MVENKLKTPNKYLRVSIVYLITFIRPIDIKKYLLGLVQVVLSTLKHMVLIYKAVEGQFVIKTILYIQHIHNGIIKQCILYTWVKRE